MRCGSWRPSHEPPRDQKSSDSEMWLKIDLERQLRLQAVLVAVFFALHWYAACTGVATYSVELLSIPPGEYARKGETQRN